MSNSERERIRERAFEAAFRPGQNEGVAAHRILHEMVLRDHELRDAVQDELLEACKLLLAKYTRARPVKPARQKDGRRYADRQGRPYAERPRMTWADFRRLRGRD